MFDDKTIACFVGRRGGAIVGTWSTRPVMMDVNPQKRTQDADLEFEEMPEDHAEVAAFRARPLPRPVDRVAVLETKIAALEMARATK